jgi:2-hydroxy-6-oxonona-2,4-dienedioate hydrolase
VRSRYERVAGLRGHAREGGSGPPAVLVHGLAVSSRYFEPLAQRLEGRFHVLAPDLPGHGRSGSPPRALDIPELADALTEWLDITGIERATLVANSLGGQISVDLAVRRPERVARLVLVGSTMDPAAPSLLAQALRLACDIPREPFRLNVVEARDYLRTGPRRALTTTRMALADPLEDKLTRVAAPTLVVRGEHDPIAPQAWAERMVDLLPDGRAVVIPGAAHAAHWSAADAVARHVEEA